VQVRHRIGPPTWSPGRDAGPQWPTAWRHWWSATRYARSRRDGWSAAPRGARWCVGPTTTWWTWW